MGLAICLDAKRSADYSIAEEAPQMRDLRDFEELKRLGASRPAPEAIAVLYQEAFDRFGVESLWSRCPSAHPTITQALVIAESLRREGSMKSWPLAAQIEESCRAAL